MVTHWSPGAEVPGSNPEDARVFQCPIFFRQQITGRDLSLAPASLPDRRSHSSSFLYPPCHLVGRRHLLDLLLGPACTCLRRWHRSVPSTRAHTYLMIAVCTWPLLTIYSCDSRLLLGPRLSASTVMPMPASVHTSRGHTRPLLSPRPIKSTPVPH